MADRNIYVGGTNGKASQPTKIYVGNTSDKARLVTKVYVGNSSNKAVQVWPKLKWAEIYQKCQYLYNTSVREYIDTGIKPDSNMRVILDAEKTTTTASTRYERYFFYSGTLNTSSSKFALSWYRIGDSSNLYYYFGTSSITLSHDLGTSNLWTTRHVYDFNRSGGYFYIDNTYVGQSMNVFGAEQYSLKLWRTSNNSDPEYDSIKFRLYSFKIYQGNNLVRDFVPCYRKNDLKPGLYDFANDVFYTNAGSGEFYKGPDVN